MKAYHEQALAYLKGEMSESERKAFEESLPHIPELRAEVERSREVLDLLEAANEESTIARVNDQIRQAIDRHASDIHIIRERQEVVVRVRIDGQLEEMERLPEEMHRSVVDRWKAMAECHLGERQLPQDGRVRIQHAETEFDLRVNVMPTISGERVTVRILST